jgi:DNA-binding MarR family transcriptional regulator
MRVVSRNGDALAAIEWSMNRIRRSQTRHSLGRRAADERGEPFDLTHVLVVDALEEGPGDEPGVTVGTVGERLGIDPSRASRVVAAAVAAGYVRRVASQADGRRIHLELTDAGRELAGEVHRFRRAAFARATEGWSAAERDDLARLLGRFVEGLATA